MGTMEQEATRRLTWRSLLWGAAAANLGVLALIALITGDREAWVFTVLYGVGVILMRLRSFVTGAIMLAVLGANAAAWMFPAAASNVINREQVLDVMIPASLAVISLTAAIAAVGSIVTRSKADADGKAVRIVAQTAIAVFVLAAGAAVIQRGEQAVARAGDIVVDMHSASFTPDALMASGGRVTVAVANRDLFWHTFTIDALSVDVGVPTRGERRATFDALPGRYEYYCAVPGHALLGMKGMLLVV